jgi:hypothetical protein
MTMRAGQVSLYRFTDRKELGQRLAGMALLIFVLAPVIGGAQQPAPQTAAQPPAAQTAPNVEVAANNQPPAAPQTAKQKQLADDTAKLLQLANELKVELDKSSKDTLSLNVMKKAEQVEKLAHKVRDEMMASLLK